MSLYSYAFSKKSPLYTSPSSNYTYSPSSWDEGLKNRVFFTWAFVEVITWFWVFVTLREERREFAQRLAIRRAAEEEDRL